MSNQFVQEGTQRRAIESVPYTGRSSANLTLLGLSQLARYSQARSPLGLPTFTLSVPAQPRNSAEDLPLSAHAAAVRSASAEQDWLASFFREIEELPALAA